VPGRPTAAPTRVAAAKPSATPAPAAASAGQAEWTVLVYLDGDNDLEQDAIGDYAEMASVGSSAAVNIVVQFDRVATSEDWDDSSNGNWSDVKRFRVERGKKPTKSNQLSDLGELNMGDPRTLVDFAAWGIKAYPARHYALIFWDHGAAWPGVASDDSSDGDMLTLPELAGALSDVRKRTGVPKLDLIGFDACLMGQIDVLQAIAPFGDVAIGSADLEPGEGWAWNAWLSDLARRPPQNAAALAPSIIKSFTAFYKQQDDASVTLAAFDLNKVGQMTGQLDALAGAMLESMSKSYKVIGKARSYAAEYASGDADIGYCENISSVFALQKQGKPASYTYPPGTLAWIDCNCLTPTGVKRQVIYDFVNETLSPAWQARFINTSGNNGILDYDAAVKAGVTEESLKKSNIPDMKDPKFWQKMIFFQNSENFDRRLEMWNAFKAGTL